MMFTTEDIMLLDPAKVRGKKWLEMEKVAWAIQRGEESDDCCMDEASGDLYINATELKKLIGVGKDDKRTC